MQIQKEYSPDIQSSTSYDLIPSICQYLDLHLIFPLLDFVDEIELYEKESVLRAKLELLEPTKMIDYAVDIFKALHPNETSEHLDVRRCEVLKELEELKAETESLNLALDSSPGLRDGQSDLFQSRDSHLLSDAMMSSYAKLAKLHYDCGDYTTASVKLDQVFNLTGGVNGSKKGPSLLWGRLACAILNQNGERGFKLVEEVKQMIDLRPYSALEQLQQRSWLLHWSLFICFHNENGLRELISLFFEEKFLQAIQSNTPWLLRYLVVAVVLTRNTAIQLGERNQVLTDLIQVIEQEQVNYSDPITKFVESLCIHLDFDNAMHWRNECEKVMKADFFLKGICESFMEATQLFTFETYCRIHRKIDISMLALKMSMHPDDAEKWVADLIRNSKLNAKIDSRNNIIVMGTTRPTVYEQVIEKTDDLSMRSSLLLSNLKQYSQDLSNGTADEPNYGQMKGNYQRNTGKSGVMSRFRQ